jgi:hypothetical protein
MITSDVSVYSLELRRLQYALASASASFSLKQNQEIDVLALTACLLASCLPATSGYLTSQHSTASSSQCQGPTPTTWPCMAAWPHAACESCQGELSDLQFGEYA